MDSLRLKGIARLWLASGLALAALSLAACGGDDGGGAVTGDVARGEAAVNSRACKSCHGDDLSGKPDELLDPNHADTKSYSSNLTPDVATGLGDWTDEDVDLALRTGKDDVNDEMCAPMPIYRTMSAQESADIIAYLRSIPAVSKVVMESACPSQ